MRLWSLHPRYLHARGLVALWREARLPLRPESDPRRGDVRLSVTAGQLAHEWAHLRAKLELRAPADLARMAAVDGPEPHPMFDVVAGGVEAWERLGGPLDGPGRAR